MFDARNPLSTRSDPSTNAPLKDPLRQNQFGLSLGGPIAKDRTFWFGNFERTQLDRTGIVTIAPVAVAAINARARRVRLSLDRGSPPATIRPATTRTNVFGRVDHQVDAAASRLQVRYSLYDVGSENARNVGGAE